MEIYNIDDVIEDDVLYYDFYHGFSNHIAALVLRTLPIDDKPVKYTTYIESLSDRNLHKTRRILSDIEIFLNSVQGVTIPMLQNEVRAISLAEYTDHDYIYKEEGLRLTIIQERLVIPMSIREEIKNGK